MTDASTDLYADADGRLARRRSAVPPAAIEPYALDEEDAFDPEWSSINPDGRVLEPIIPPDRPQSSDRLVMTAFVKPAERGPRKASAAPAPRRARRVLAKPKKRPAGVRVLRPFVSREPAGRVLGHAALLTILVGLLAAAAVVARPQPVEAAPPSLAAWAGVAGLATMLVGLFLTVRIVAGSMFANLAALAAAAIAIAPAWAGEAAIVPTGLATLSLGLTATGWRSRSITLLTLGGLVAGAAVGSNAAALGAAVPVLVAAVMLLQPRRGGPGTLPSVVGPVTTVAAWAAVRLALGMPLTLGGVQAAWPAPEGAGSTLMLLGGLGGLGLLAMLVRRPEAGVALTGWTVAMFIGFGGLTIAAVPGVLAGAAYAAWRVLAAPVEGRGEVWRALAAPVAAGGLVALFVLTCGTGL